MDKYNLGVLNNVIIDTWSLTRVIYLEWNRYNVDEIIEKIYIKNIKDLNECEKVTIIFNHICDKIINKCIINSEILNNYINKMF